MQCESSVSWEINTGLFDLCFNLDSTGNYPPVTNTLNHLKMKVWNILNQPHHIVFSLYQPIRWQHGSLHGCALEHSFDLTANAADPKGLAPL